MVFSSATFLFLFLPLTLVLSRCLPGIRAQNWLLLAASLVFYSFGGLYLTPLLLASALLNYGAGRLVAQPKPWRKAALIGAVIVNLALLGVFKYLNFFTACLDSIPGLQVPVTDITLPIGISFFTFQGMSYVIDVYRQPEMVSRDPGKVLLYISFFPQLVAGPIVKYLDISRQLDARGMSPALTAQGIARFVLGLSKKLLLANSLGSVADAVYALTASQLDIRLAWLGAVCYTLQIYFDFSGYSDMAIGLGKMFGFHFKENFRHPYCSGSIQEFWRRWHISLSSWFRDYLYIPLGGNRHGVAKTRRNRLIVFFLTGLWHGANWTFILWGLWHGFLLTAEEWLRSKGWLKSRVFGHLYTMLAVTLGFMLFRADTLGQAWAMLRAMFSGFAVTPESSALFHNLCSPVFVVVLVLSVLFCAPVLSWVQDRWNARGKALPELPAGCLVLVLLVLDILNLAATSFNPFIYFQF